MGKNKYINFIKETWKDKRKRALVILILYFIFFFIIITDYKSRVRNASTIKEPLVKYSELSSYDYNVNLEYYSNGENHSSQYSGINYNSQTKWSVNDETYYLNRSELSTINDIITYLNYNLTPNYIYSIIKNQSLISKTEIYNENLIAKNYEINIDNINYKITTYENDSDIIRVNIVIDNIELEDNSYTNINYLINYQVNNNITLKDVSNDK